MKVMQPLRQDDVFDHADADGFIRLFGLSSKIQAMLQKEKNDS